MTPSLPAIWFSLYTFILLFILFAEPKVGKVWAGKLEENSRSRRNCRHIYSLMAGDMAKGASQVGLIYYTFTEQKWPVAKPVHCDVHAQSSYKWSQLLRNHVFRERGVGSRRVHGAEGLTIAFLANLLFPYRSHHFMANRRGESGNRDRFPWAPKSLQTMTAVVKLKDACSLQ